MTENWTVHIFLWKMELACIFYDQNNLHQHNFNLTLISLSKSLHCHKDGQVPTQVTGLSLFKAVYSEAPALKLTWTTPQSNVTISQYRVQYRISGTTTWDREVIVTGYPPLTTAFVTGLNVGTKYHVRVRAESAVGAGIWSDEQSERTYIREIFCYTNSVQL